MHMTDYSPKQWQIPPPTLLTNRTQNATRAGEGGRGRQTMRSPPPDIIIRGRLRVMYTYPF